MHDKILAFLSKYEFSQASTKKVNVNLESLVEQTIMVRTKTESRRPLILKRKIF